MIQVPAPLRIGVETVHKPWAVSENRRDVGMNIFVVCGCWRVVIGCVIGEIGGFVVVGPGIWGGVTVGQSQGYRFEEIEPTRT
jgi:hypothetical protein